MKPRTIHPEGWAPALGYANGMLMPDGTLHIGGQIGWVGGRSHRLRPRRPMMYRCGACHDTTDVPISQDGWHRRICRAFTTRWCRICL